ncbi:MAG: tetratricopeptide repeat protein [Phycisphaerae bacterium]|nr:tetratricopeptide repeat protein [Phycisphaerae bacterium]
MRFAPISLTIVSLLLLSPLACQQPQETSNPGALPRAEFENGDHRLDASTYFAHGNLLERQGNLEEARLRYEQALASVPDFTAARNRLGITLNKLGHHADASEQFRLALEQQPNAAYLYNNLGFSLFLQERYEDAWHAYSQALEINPEFARAHMNAAVALARLGRYSEAWDHFHVVGSEADAYYNLAVIQTEAGAYVEAATSLDQALKLEPGLTAARQQLRTIAKLAAEQAATRDAALQTGGNVTVAAAMEPADPANVAPPVATVPPDPSTVRNTVAIPAEPMPATTVEPPARPDTDAGHVDAVGQKMIPVRKITRPANAPEQKADLPASSDSPAPTGADASQVQEWIDELRADVERSLSANPATDDTDRA